CRPQEQARDPASYGDRPPYGAYDSRTRCLGGGVRDLCGAEGIQPPPPGRPRGNHQFRRVPITTRVRWPADEVVRGPDPVAHELAVRSRLQLRHRDHSPHGPVESPLLSAYGVEHALDEIDAGAPAADQCTAQ